MAQFAIDLAADQLTLINTAGRLITAYVIDFSTLVAQDLKAGGDGAKVIDGKAWTLVNSANATTVYLNDGVHGGIYIRCNAANTDDFNANYNGPRMVASLAALAPAISPDIVIEHQVWFMFSQPHAPNANFEFMRLGVQPYPCLPDAAGLYRRVSVSRGWNGGISRQAVYQYSSLTTASNSALYGLPGLNYDIAAFRMFPNFTVEVYGGDSVAGNFPALSALTFMGRLQMTSPPPAWDTLNMPTGATSPGWAVHFNATTGNVAGNADLLIKKLMYKCRY